MEARQQAAGVLKQGKEGAAGADASAYAGEAAEAADVAEARLAQPKGDSRYRWRLVVHRFESPRHCGTCRKMMQCNVRHVAAGLAAAVRDNAVKEAEELCVHIRTMRLCIGSTAGLGFRVNQNFTSGSTGWV